MSDRLVRAMTKDGYVKITAVSTTGIVQRARQIHKTTAVATAALGRVLTACSMIGNMQKNDQGSVTLIIKGGGPLGTILATSDPEGNVRGYVENPQVELMEKYQGKLDVGAAVGSEGTLTLIRDLHMKEPYVGTVQLLGGEIAEDIASYFVESEQVPTVCALGVLVNRDQTVNVSGGYLLQLLPGAPDDLIDRLEASVMAAGNVSTMLSGGMSPEEIIVRLLGEENVELLESSEIAYKCYCSRERVASTIISLGAQEMQSIIDDGETIHVDCQFCDTIYSFTPAEIQEMLNHAIG
ncbi:MAG: Hsp33 family molecular chaperone HslO [Oscillospiraceae bacterium]|nr:Hsp33 family molecular chaperone HslO [Oscillospiraceae bacterium]